MINELRQLHIFLHIFQQDLIFCFKNTRKSDQRWIAYLIITWSPTYRLTRQTKKHAPSCHKDGPSLNNNKDKMDNIQKLRHTRIEFKFCIMMLQ